MIVSGRHRPEIWKITTEGEVEDTGYFVSLGTPGAGARGVGEVGAGGLGRAGRGGVAPGGRRASVFGAFALSDWMVARETEVSLPFFGEENVGFRFRAGGVVGAKLKDGGEVAGTWWWSRGRLHLQLEGLDEGGDL